MATSSIHIATGKAGYLSHNDRSLKTNNSIFKDELNEYTTNSKEAFSIYRNELRTRTKAYLDNHPTRKKLHSKTVTHLSAIVNLNQHHTLEDLKPLIQHLETSLDTKVFQVAIHRDEGHIKNDKNIKNYHCHIEFMGLDSQGSSVRRKLTRGYLKDLQTQTADILQMERGQQNSKAKRLDTYEFKNHKQREENTLKPILAKQKDLKQEIATLREDLKEHKATRKDYAQLEQLNKNLKEQIKNKDLTLSDLQKQLNEYKDTTDTTIEAYRADIATKQKRLNKALEVQKALKADNDTLKSDLRAYKRDIEQLDAKPQEIIKEVEKVVEIEVIREVPKVEYVEKVVKTIEQIEVENPINTELQEEIERLKSVLNKFKNALQKLIPGAASPKEAFKALKSIIATNDTALDDKKTPEQDISDLRGEKDYSKMMAEIAQETLKIKSNFQELER